MMSTCVHLCSEQERIGTHGDVVILQGNFTLGDGANL